VSCFDKIDPFLAVELLRRLGLPEKIVELLLDLYDKILVYTRVANATAETFQPSVGIIQGCAMSGILINAIMAIWVKAVKNYMVNKHNNQVLSEILLSIFLDDRNLVATKVELLRDLLKYSEHFDKLINSELNQKKCQVYATPSLDKSEYENIMPQAQRVGRPWSLGFNLPACDDENAQLDADLQKTKSRHDKAIASAHKARLLPHDQKIRVLEAVFAAQHSYGCEYVPMDDKQEVALRKQIETTVWGHGRFTRSYAIVWAVIYKGHNLLPKNAHALRCTRVLHDAAQKVGPNTKDQFIEMWYEEQVDIMSKHETPITATWQAFRRVGWSWISPFCIETSQGNVIDIENQPWKECAHRFREALRDKLLKDPKVCQRFDMRGLDNGVDYKKSRQLLQSQKLSFLQREILRTILAGALMTPSRWKAANKMTALQAVCVHCDTHDEESTGHRYWSCPKWREIRLKYKLGDFDEAIWPRCLTRSGVAPCQCAASAKMVANIQKMMIEINCAILESPAAQAQDALVQRKPTIQRQFNQDYQAQSQEAAS